VNLSASGATVGCVQQRLPVSDLDPCPSLRSTEAGFGDLDGGPSFPRHHDDPSFGEQVQYRIRVADRRRRER
jgi:hypothetical protein